MAVKRRVGVPVARADGAAERALAAVFHEAAPRLIGCACGAERVETREKPFVDTSGTVHRYGRPCYRVELEP